jgi:hypothetical protein
MYSINAVQTHGGSQYHCFPQSGVGSGAGEDRLHERNRWVCEIARRCQRDCSIERLVAIEIVSKGGSRLFGGWHRQTNIGHCSPWWIRHSVKQNTIHVASCTNG